MNRTKLESHISEAMAALQQMPCGGIGADGPGRDELDAAEQAGQVYGGDAEYHQAQSAWLWLNETLKELKKE